MSTARELPPHGTYARANGSPRYRKPCKCEPCLLQRRRSDKQWKVQRELGRVLWVDATQAREHLEKLRETRTWASIAEAGQMPESNLYYIANGQRTTIHRKTHARILAIQPLAKPIASMQIDALGTRRRLQALMTIGHSVRSIATASTVARDRIHDIAMDLQPTVRHDVAERIAATYERLAFRPPAKTKFTSRTRNLAANRGWHGPLAWDDIDDPNCQPETDGYKPIAKNGRDSMRRGEIAHLLSLGESVATIARRMNANEKYISDLIGQGLSEPSYETAA